MDLDSMLAEGLICPTEWDLAHGLLTVEQAETECEKCGIHCPLEI
jgi:hypothetical protein